MPTPILTIWLLAISSLPSFHAYADASADNELEQLLALDLSSLAQVSVASKRQENVWDAPGILTVITAQEIRRYGARNLRDVLDRQTSLQVIGSNTFPHGRVSMRGNTFVHNDNTVLLLLNGRSLLEGFGGSTNLDIYEYFPLDSIKQIEIIRGPGSVLYGTNAVAGVINIITHEPDEANTELALGYGSYDSKQADFSGGGSWNDLAFYGAISARDFDGEDFNGITDQFNVTDTYRTGGNGVAGVLQLRYKDFTLDAFSNESSNDNAGAAFSVPSDDIDIDRHFIALGYKNSLNDNWDIAANISYHYQLSRWTVTAAGGAAGLASENIFTELTSRGRLTDKASLLLGATFREENGIFKNNAETWNSNTFNGFAQLDYALTKRWMLLGGLQYNKPKALSGDVSLRAGTVFHFNRNWGIKALWAEAFREPAAFEKFLNQPGVVVGNPMVEPETSETLDLQLFYEQKRGSLSATFYHSTLDRISRVGNAPQQIANAGEVSFYGLELEGKWQLGNGFSVLGNASYQTTQDQTGAHDVVYAPNIMFKTGINYESYRGYQIGIFNSYFSESALQNADFRTVTAFNPEADAYHLLTANVNIELGKLTGERSLDNMSLALYADNLLDEDIYFPSVSATSVNSLPHHMGRGFYGTLRIRF